MTETRPPRHAGQSGFTLIEVLVALTILAVSIGVLLDIFSGAVKRQNAVADQRTAILLLQSKLDQVGVELPLDDGERDGVFDNGFGWKIEIGAYADAPPGATIATKLVTATVFWPHASGPRSVVVTTVRLLEHD